MPSKPVVIGTIVAFTLLGFLLTPHAPLGSIVWGPLPEGGMEPVGGQIAALMIVSVLECIAFGLGAAFLLFGFPLVRRLIPSAGLARAAWVAIGWSLVSWVPHTALHMTAGDDIGKLIGIEYAFHVTLVLGGAALAAAFFTAARARADGAHRVRHAADAADA